ncbi:sulfotransferase family protein [Motilibacter aurantiacus]|uniref:sulfotransferase family protein n=1 Tax=Motilibacter aurantiacus TaxID=2714955 RepID=UPI00140A9276|nr:sulfotransferase [Motilibacter aurantiacus]NHC47340.1 sulfotransferase [Motilibacter aurantiacus]
MAQPSPATAGAGPIFLVGTMRSGTTLLRLVLDSHERLAIADESGFLRAVAAAKCIPDQHDGDGWYRRLGLSDEEMNERLRAFYDDLFSGFAARQGKPRWGDKTPFHINSIALLAEVFPDAAVIGIVRHPGAVVASQLRRGIGFDAALHGWLTQNARLLRAVKRGEPAAVTVLRYEDLVAAPEPTLRALLGFLHETWSPRLLAHHEVQRRQGAPRVVEGGTRAWDPISTGRNDRWRGELTPAQLSELLESTAALRTLLRYEESGAAALPGPLLRGADLTGRGLPAIGRGGDHARTPAAARAAAPRTYAGAVSHFLRMARTDPAYTARRLPVVLRSRLRRL